MVLAQQCAPQVAPQTLAAIVRTESGFQPLAIGVNGGRRLVRQPESVDEAVATAKWLIANGYSIDVGLGQVNSANLRKTGLSIEEAFDPCKNLAASATILHANYLEASRRTSSPQSALDAALSAYNTGNFVKGVSNGYVQRVHGNATAGAVPEKMRPDMSSTAADSRRTKRISGHLPPSPRAVEAGREMPGESWNVYSEGHDNELVF